jgi:hypothetical protein
MSVSKISLFLKVALPSAEIKSRVENSEGLKYEQLQDLSNFLKGLKGGQESAFGVIEIGEGSDGGLSASGLVTIAGSGAQSVTINGGALTGGTDYDIANLSATEIAANIVAAISNSQSSRVQSVYAESSGAVVSLFSKPAGEVGNLVTTTATGDASASGATLASGAEGSQRVLKFNLNS